MRTIDLTVNSFGYAVTLGIFVTLTLASFGLMQRLLVRLGTPRVIALGLVGLGMLISAPYWTVRPQLLTWFLLAVFINVIIERDRPAWVLVPVLALWANLHAGFLFGLALLGLFAAADALRRRSWRLAWLCALAAAAVLANPYGIDAYLVPWEHWTSIGDLSEYIREWQEASVLHRWLWPFWGVLLSAYAAVLLRYCRRRDVPLEHLGALFLFSLSASSHIRTGVYFVSTHVPSKSTSMIIC